MVDWTSRIAFRTSRCHPLLVPGQLTKKGSFEHSCCSLFLGMVRYDNEFETKENKII